MSLFNLAKFTAAPLCRDPFDYLVVPGFLKAQGLERVHADYPKVVRPGSFPLSEVTYGPAFGALIEQLRSDAVREAFAQKFAVDLNNRPTMFTVRGQCWEKDGNIHTDSATKIITILIYMNPKWEESGGRLRLLRSGTDLDDVIVEVPPEEGTMLCFRRSENSWHGHKKFVGPRRVIQMNWVTSQKVLRYESSRHRLSAAFKRIVLRAS